MANPTIAVLAALLVGFCLPELDSVLTGHLSGRVSGLLFGGDADAARSLLGLLLRSASAPAYVPQHQP